MSSAPTFDPEDPLDFTELAQAVEALPRPLAVAFALRCALRVLPLTAPKGRFPKRWNWHQAKTPLSACLATMDWIATTTDTSEAAREAHSVAMPPNDRASSAAADAAAYAARTAHETHYARLAVRAAEAATRAVRESDLLGLNLLSSTSQRLVRTDIQDLAHAALTESDPRRAALVCVARPLWGDTHPESDRYITPHVTDWSDALSDLALAEANASSSDIQTETKRLIAAYEGILAGTPDWLLILQAPPDERTAALIADSSNILHTAPDDSTASRKTDQGKPVAPPQPAAPSLPVLPTREWPLLLARLAYRNPATLALAEAPAPGTFERLVSPEERRDLPALAATLARETGDFSPDPLWLAWIQAAHPAFFAALTPGSESAPRPPITEPESTTPPEPPPSSSSSPPPRPPARSAASKRKK